MKEIAKQIAMTLMEVVLYIGIVFLVFGMIGGAMVFLRIVDAGDFTSTDILDPYSTLLIDYLPVFIGSIIGIYIVHRLIFKRSYEFSGFGREKVFKQFVIGLLWSAAILSFGTIILLVFDYLDIVGIEMNLSLFLGFLLFFLIQSSFEELAVRSFLLSTIAHRSTIWIGILSSSAIFTLLHIGNANINALSLFNIFLAGLLLGVIYIRYGQIWAPIGLHAGWNFLQGSFFGYEVSGISVYSFIDTIETGPDLITGGKFGFEGSIIGCIMIMASTYWIWRSAPEKFTTQYHPEELILNPL